MNGENKNKNQVAMLVEEAKNIAIIPSKLAGLDAFCAGAALFHMLKAQDKNVSFLYTGKLPEKSHNIISSEDVTSDVGKRSLTVSMSASCAVAAQQHVLHSGGTLTNTWGRQHYYSHTGSWSIRVTRQPMILSLRSSR